MIKLGKISKETQGQKLLAPGDPLGRPTFPI